MLEANNTNLEMILKQHNEQLLIDIEALGYQIASSADIGRIF